MENEYDFIPELTTTWGPLYSTFFDYFLKQTTTKFHFNLSMSWSHVPVYDQTSISPYVSKLRPVEWDNQRTAVRTRYNQWGWETWTTTYRIMIMVEIDQVHTRTVTWEEESGSSSREYDTYLHIHELPLITNEEMIPHVDKMYVFSCWKGSGTFSHLIPWSWTTLYLKKDLLFIQIPTKIRNSSHFQPSTSSSIRWSLYAFWYQTFGST